MSSASSSSSTIGHQVASGSRSSLLMSRIDFTPGEYECSLAAQALQNKYHLLTPKDKSKTTTEGGTNGSSKSKSTELVQSQGAGGKQQRLINGNHEGNCAAAGDGIPVPRIQLYSPANVHLEWQQTHKIGAGLVNLGNTCFMNTVIQCLTYCPPLVNYLLHGDHASKCKVQGFCMMCELQKHMKRTLDRPNEVIKPLYIYQKLKSDDGKKPKALLENTIAKHFQFGRQEDAHEFLRYVVDNMWKASLSNSDASLKLDPASKETTVVNQIFGGYHRSQVTCLQCKEKSNTYDHFMDFILDIKQNVSSLEKALEKFVLPELLQNENAYKCPRCNMKVPAQKRFTVHRPPNVATFQLKRFDYNRMLGGKITKHISYPEKLDLRPFMSDHKGSPVPYRLNAVLVHLGVSCNSGHYFCYVRNCNGVWYLMDDAKVHQVSLNQVLNQQAYVLFYVRVPTNSHSVKKSPSSQPAIQRIPSSLTNGSLDLPATELRGSPAHRGERTPQKVASASSLVGLVNGSNENGLPLSQARDKVTFGIRRPVLGENQSVVGSNVKTPMVKKQMSDPTNGAVGRKGLVPYHGDSSDSSDNDQKLPRKSCDAIPTTSKNQLTNPSKLCHSNSLSVSSASNTRVDNAVKDSHVDKTVSEPTLPGTSSSCSTVLLGLKSSNLQKTLSARSNAIRGLTGDLSSSSSLNTSSSIASKVKATAMWHVSDTSMHSPSVASESSTNSVNSTTDWNVIEQDAPRSKTERVYMGWKVTNTSDRENSVASSKEKDDARSKNSSRQGSTETQSEKDGHVPSESLESKRSSSPTPCTKGKSNESLLANGETSGVSCGAHSELECAKEVGIAHNKGSVQSSMNGNESSTRWLPACTRKVSSCPSENQSFPLEKANSKRSPPGVPGGNRGSKGDKADDSGNHHGNALSKRRESELHVDGAESDSSLHKRHKKGISATNDHRLSKKEKSREKHCKREKRSSSSDRRKHREHKTGHSEKKHGRHWYQHNGLGSGNQDSGEQFIEEDPLEGQKLVNERLHGSGRTSGNQINDAVHDTSNCKSDRTHEHGTNMNAKHHSYRHHHWMSKRKSPPDDSSKEDDDSGSSSSSSTSSSSSSSSSGELEWVEKTKETVEAERMLSEKREAPSKYWDSDVKDGHKNYSDRHHHQYGSSEVQWNGTYKSSAVDKLIKLSSRGYGNGVRSWDGNVNHIDREMNNDHYRKRYHNYDDDDDDDYDRGKTKKIRRNQSSSHSLPYNPFQRVQEQRYQDRYQSRSRFWSDKYDNGYRRHNNYYRNSNDRNSHYHRHYRSKH